MVAVKDARVNAKKRSTSPREFQTSAAAQVRGPRLMLIAIAIIGAVRAVNTSPVVAGITKTAGKTPLGLLTLSYKSGRNDSPTRR